MTPLKPSFEEFTELATRHQVPITWTALLAGMTGPGKHRRYLDRAAEQREAGLTIVPQVACRPIMFDFNFDEPYPFELWPLFRPTMTTDRQGRMALYRNLEFREAFKVESAPDAKNANAGWASRTMISRHDADPSLEERALAEVARARGMDPVDLILDLSLETGLRSRFRRGREDSRDPDDGQLAPLPATPPAVTSRGRRFGGGEARRGKPPPDPSALGEAQLGHRQLDVRPAVPLALGTPQ